MAQTLTINGTGYAFPDVGDTTAGGINWGQAVLNWATAVTAGMLQKSGGSFSLTAEVDFGASFGLKSIYYKTRTANPASAGIVRMANNEGIAWRNAANSADLILKADNANLLTFNGVEIPGNSYNAGRALQTNNGSGRIETAVTTTVELGYLVGVTSAIQTQLNTKLTDPLTTNGDIIVRAGGVSTRLAIGGVGTVLKSDGAAVSWGTLAGSGDVVGPASATDNAIVRYDLTTGKLIQNSGVIIDDSNNVSGIVNLVSQNHRPNGAGYDLGNSGGSAWVNLFLDNGATHGGRVNFDGGATSYIGSNAAGTTLEIAGFTSIQPTVDAALSIGANTKNFKDLYLDNGATDSGAIYFNAGTTSFLKGTADGTSRLTLAGFGGFEMTAANLAKTTAPQADTLYPNSMIKAWAVLTCGGAGAVTVTEGFNVNTASYSTTDMTINFHTALGSTAYISNGTVLDSGGGAAVEQAYGSTKNVGSVVMRRSTNWASGDVLEVLVVGVQ